MSGSFPWCAATPWRATERVNPWQFRALALAVAFSVATASCAPKVVRVYDGPRRPRDSVARIEAPDRYQIMSVDDVETNVPTVIRQPHSDDEELALPGVEVPPGCHEVTVAYEETFQSGRGDPHPTATVVLIVLATIVLSIVLNSSIVVTSGSSEDPSRTYRVLVRFVARLDAGRVYRPYASMSRDGLVIWFAVLGEDGQPLGALPPSGSIADPMSGC